MDQTTPYCLVLLYLHHFFVLISMFILQESPAQANGYLMLHCRDFPEDSSPPQCETLTVYNLRVFESFAASSLILDCWILNSYPVLINPASFKRPAFKSNFQFNTFWSYLPPSHSYCQSFAGLALSWNCQSVWSKGCVSNVWGARFWHFGKIVLKRKLIVLFGKSTKKKIRPIWFMCCAQSLSHVQLCNPLNGRPPGSPVHGGLQARILEWVAISFSRGSSQPRDQAHISCVSRTAGGFFSCWAIRDVDRCKNPKQIRI